MSRSVPRSSSSRSLVLANRAAAVMAGGVTAGGRRNGALGTVSYFARARGPWLWDIEDRRFVDYTSSSGASMLGYDVPELNAAVESALGLGTMCTWETPHHVELCERLVEILPGAEAVRLTSTGTEATMAAIRLARGATGRRRVLKFDGHFHGMHEAAFFNTATPPELLGPEVRPVPGSAGVLPEFGESLVIIPFNDTPALDAALARYGSELAAVILEPVSYNQGCIPADPAWLLHLRDETRRRGIVLIFDEVLSGFRMALGGAAEHYGIEPDLATWAKALGAGWPIAALTGRRTLMDHLNPDGPVVVSGTYSSHLASVLAALAALEIMAAPGFYENLNRRASRLYAGIQAALDAASIPGRVQGVGARFGIYFGVTERVANYEQARRFDRALAVAFVREAFDEGLYFHDFGSRAVPMHYGITAAHDDAVIDDTIERLSRVMPRLRGITPGL